MQKTLPSIRSTPIPGLRIIEPRIPPGPNQRIISYEVCPPEVGCCKCRDLTKKGVTTLTLCTIFCLPFACMPCMMPSMHEGYQRPIYGNIVEVVQPPAPVLGMEQAPSKASVLVEDIVVTTRTNMDGSPVRPVEAVGSTTIDGPVKRMSLPETATPPASDTSTADVPASV